MSQRLVIGINIIITATQQWLPHGWRQWNFISTGGKFPTQPIINIPKRLIKRDAEKLSQNNKQTNNKAPPFWLNSGGNAVVMGSHNKNTTSKSLMSESTRAFIAQLQSAVLKHVRLASIAVGDHWSF